MRERAKTGVNRFGLLCFALLAACGNREPTAQQSRPVRPPLTPRATEPSAIVVGSSGETTRRADERFGRPGATSTALQPLPPLTHVSMNAPGSELHPAIMLKLPDDVSPAVLEAAYAHAYQRLGNMDGWFPLADTADGWRDFVIADHARPSRRIACAIDLLDAASQDLDVASGLRALHRGCDLLRDVLGGHVRAALDDAAVLRAANRIRRAAMQHGALALQFTAPDGLPFVRVHTTARSLGFTRSDFGGYAWYNDQQVGHDQLLLLDPGVHPDQVESVDARTPSITLRVNLMSVPLPDVVGERMWRAAVALERELGTAPRWFDVHDARVSDRTPVTAERFRARLDQAVAALRAVGFGRDYVIAAPH